MGLSLFSQAVNDRTREHSIMLHWQRFFGGRKGVFWKEGCFDIGMGWPFQWEVVESLSLEVFKTGRGT